MLFRPYMLLNDLECVEIDDDSICQDSIILEKLTYDGVTCLENNSILATMFISHYLW